VRIYDTECTPSQEILVRPIGGLGNQLFIYGIGFALSRINECELHIDPTWFESQNLRHFELNSFFLEGHLSAAKMKSRFSRKSLSEFCEKSFAFDSDIWHVKPGTSLKGYFQSWKYLEECAADLRTQIHSIVDPSPWFLDQRDMLEKLGEWTSVHIRRGDYQKDGIRQYHGLLELNYYDRALSCARQLDGKRPIVLFSDDLTQACEIMNSLAIDFLPLKPPPGTRPLEVMILMSLASSAVIANSSFSWWGAWLGDNASRSVIAPRPWFNDSHIHDRDLFPSHWITVGR
jgi:hypothetical protein